MAETRYATDPEAIKNYSTQQLRDAFLIEKIFEENKVSIVHSHFDRFIVGGIKVVSAKVPLNTYDFLKAEYFLERRELGIINVGATGSVQVDGTSYTLEKKDALYIGKGVKDILFSSDTPEPALFYFNSAPAHAVFPTKKITPKETETVVLGTVENSNQRTIRKLIVNSVLQTCQLQMGMTELKTGSVWNTMPPHVHDRRMEAYFYFDLPEHEVVCHFMGEPEETRHIFVKNQQAVISPPWSIHSGAGTSNYAFIWGMAGENLDYGDMDGIKPFDLK